MKRNEAKRNELQRNFNGIERYGAYQEYSAICANQVLRQRGRVDRWQGGPNANHRHRELGKRRNVLYTTRADSFGLQKTAGLLGYKGWVTKGHAHYSSWDLRGLLSQPHRPLLLKNHIALNHQHGQQHINILKTGGGGLGTPGSHLRLRPGKKRGYSPSKPQPIHPITSRLHSAERPNDTRLCGSPGAAQA